MIRPVMRFLLAFLVLQSWTLAGTPAQLDALKKEFPKHVAGPMSETTDPEVAMLYFRYKDNVRKMNVDALEAQFEAMREEMRMDISKVDLERYRAAPLSKGAQQNDTWLKTKVRPWLMKLEAMIVTPHSSPQSPTPPRR